MTDLDPGILIRFRNWLDSGYAEPYMIEQFRQDLCALLAVVDINDPADTPSDCPHCPDGHRDPNTRPWAVWVTQTRVDGQPPYLMAAPTNGAHVAESDAEWLRQVIHDAKARRHRPLTEEPCGVIPTKAGLNYLALRRQQHPESDRTARS